MATSSEVKAGLDDIAGIIREHRRTLAKCVASAQVIADALGGIPTTYADVIATIDGYAAGTTNTFELLAKAEKAKLQTEFTALRTDALAIAGTNLTD